MKVIIAGGGTGGHIYPAVSLAKELLRRDSGTDILFVGTKRGLENFILPKEGFMLKRIWVGGLIRKGLLKTIVSLCKLPVGLVQSAVILCQFKPDMVLGVGGYVAGPLVFCAYILRIPIVIQEQNLFPGVTNRILGRFADRIAVSFKETKNYFSEKKVVFTGNPVRREILEKLKTETGDMKKSHFTIFIFGGSQGAENINRAVVSAIDYLGEFKDSVKIIHQTGKNDEESVKKEYSKKGFTTDVRAFIYEIADIYKEADLVICRAGATSVSELLVAGQASILIPLPTAAHNHQEINARRLKEAGAAEMILEKDLTGELLAKTITDLIKDEERLKGMRKKSREMAIPDASERVIGICYAVLKERNRLTAMSY